MKLGITAEFPLGTYTGHRNGSSPDRLPDPARLHAALLNAAAQGPRAAVGDDGRLLPREEDAAALRWLEDNLPDGIFVPENLPVSTTSIMAFRKEGVLRKEDGGWKDKTTGRGVADRTAVNGAIGWVWNDAPEYVRSSVEALLPDVGCLGEADSPVVLRVADVEPTIRLTPRASAFDGGGVDLRVARTGRTEALMRAHTAANAKSPSQAQDKHKSSELPSPAPAVAEATAKARYVAPEPEYPDAPWTKVRLLPITEISGYGEAIPALERVPWAVTLHRLLIARIGDGAAPMFTGAYAEGAARPANRLAIQYLHPSVLTHLDGDFSRGAFALLVPRDATFEDVEQLNHATEKLRRVRRKSGWIALRNDFAEDERATTDFWPEPPPGTVRLWHTDPAAVPETRPQAKNGSAWSLADAALLSLGMVWRDEIEAELGRARGTERYELMRKAVRARSARVEQSRALHASTARHYVHKVHQDLVVQPYRAIVNLGELAGPRTLTAIGQSRHLGGGLLVPVDYPSTLVNEDGELTL